MIVFMAIFSYIMLEVGFLIYALIVFFDDDDLFSDSWLGKLKDSRFESKKKFVKYILITFLPIKFPLFIKRKINSMIEEYKEINIENENTETKQNQEITPDIVQSEKGEYLSQLYNTAQREYYINKRINKLGRKHL